MTIESMMKNLRRSFELDDRDEGKEGDRKFYGVVTGHVLNPVDPMGLGRVQVQLPFIDGADLSPWARVAGPMAGIFHDSYFVPDVTDEVLVAFEQGDTSVPYIIGCLWNSIQRPPLPTPIPQIRGIRTLVGNQIVFTEAPPSITIQTGPTSPVPMPTPGSPVGPHQTVEIGPTGIRITSPLGITLMSGLNSISITPAGISISGPAPVELLSLGEIKIQAPKTGIGPGVECSINAGMVRINS
jgi:hypothetical protein